MSDGQDDNVLDFPRERAPWRELGISALTRLLDADPEMMSGHWCSFCKGIWYGFKLEVACPKCGNRHG
jgi:hypothetical protein